MSSHIITLPVSGMNCFSCVKTITNALKGEKTILNAQVNLSQAEAVIGFNDSLIQTDQISKNH